MRIKYKPIHGALGGVFIAGIFSGAVAMNLYMVQSHMDMVIKYAKSTSDYNRLAIKYSKSVLEHLKAEADSTSELLMCKEVLMKEIKKVCPKPKKKVRKRKKKVDRKRVYRKKK